MRCTQETIDAIISLYNDVTRAHKRAPVQKYVQKQLFAGEPVEIVSGHPRWSSALVFLGTPEDMQIEFRINPALPDSFKKPLIDMQNAFSVRLTAYAQSIDN